MNHLNATKQNPKLQFKKSTVSKLNDLPLFSNPKLNNRACSTVLGTIDDGGAL